MNEAWVIVLLTVAAGSCIPLGGLLAKIERIHPNWLERELRHFIIAFGGGILLGAVAVVLVPEGRYSMGDSLWSIPIILLGGLAFFYIEKRMAQRHRESPQLFGMLLDYIPEAIALGGLMALQSEVAPLLALFIGLQNLPEGFNSYRELNAKNHRDDKKTIQSMIALVALGPAAGLLGYYILSDHPALLGAIMLFASGGILYLLFQDIAPQSILKKHWAPPLGAVIGFCLALFCEMIVTQG